MAGIALSENEQVSRGQDLLQILRASPEQALDSERGHPDHTEGADVKVIVKHTFIEMVDPHCRRTMNRSMSDSALLYSASDNEQLWQKMSPPWQKISDEKVKAQDFSDASTTISNDGEDPNAWGGARCRNDTCWSDDEGTMEMPMQQSLPYQYVESWWMMPMVMPDGTTVMCAPMQDGSYMSPQWEDHSNIECTDDAVAEQPEWRTTVMLRNMPNNYTRDMLLELVDYLGFAGCYDFAYLPVDFKSQSGLGYAFINFCSTFEAQRCFECFEGYCDWKVPSEKVCTVTWGSPYQGLEAHVERYQNSPVMHHSIPDEWKPVLLENGALIEFPAPTKQIKTPKIRQQPVAN